MRDLVFLPIILAALVVAVRSPFGALLAYLWFALFRPQEFVYADITGFRLSLLVGVILLLRSVFAGQLPNLTHPTSRLMVLFLLTGLTAQAFAANAAVGWEWFNYFFRLTLVCLLIITLVNSRHRFVLVVLMVGISLGFYTTKAGLVSLLAGGARFAEGLSGSFVDNNGYALAAVMTMPLLYAASKWIPDTWPAHTWIARGLLVGIPLTCFAAVSTFSRGGLLALAASTVAFIVLFRKRRLASLAGLAALLIAVLPFVPIPDGYTERMQTIYTYEEVGDDSAISRFHFWAVAWDMVVDNPLGVGMRNYDYAYDEYDTTNGRFGHGRAVHNSHLQVLAEQGFLGFAIWCAMFVLAFRACRRVRGLGKTVLSGSEDGRFLEIAAGALMVSMIGFIVGGTFIALALNDLTWITFALVGALDRIASAILAAKNEGAREIGIEKKSRRMKLNRPVATSARRAAINRRLSA